MAVILASRAQKSGRKHARQLKNCRGSYIAMELTSGSVSESSPGRSLLLFSWDLLDCLGMDMPVAGDI